MEMIRPVALQRGGLAGWGVTVLLVSPVAGGGVVSTRLAALGARVVVQSDLDTAVELVLQEAGAMNMLVIDCDHAGGLAAGLQGFDRMAAGGVRLPVMLISSACTEQTFPVGREAPFHLRAPPSVVALRIGFELAFSSRQDPMGTEKGRSREGAPFRI